MERNELALEQEMRRVWDVEQVKQLMHKRVFLQAWDRRQEELDTLWVTEPERKRPPPTAPPGATTWVWRPSGATM